MKASRKLARPARQPGPDCGAGLTIADTGPVGNAAFRRTIGDDAAVGYFYDPVGMGRDRHVVGDDDDRMSFGIQLVENAQDIFTALPVERAGGLVGEDDVAVVHQRPRDRDTLLLAAGKLAGPVTETISKTKPHKQFPRADAARR